MTVSGAITRPHHRLLADVGGTYTRLAWQEGAGTAIRDHAVYRCADHASLQAVIEHYLHEHAPARPKWAAIGIANPVLGDAVRMTNHHWSFSIAQLQAALGLDRLVVLNDFTALALALPALGAEDLRVLGGGKAQADAALALIGPGTGLGVSGLVPAPGLQWSPISGEGGHVSLSAATEEEAAVVHWLARRFGHASAERALSGPGLSNLHDACNALRGCAEHALPPEDVIAGARAQPDSACGQALALFCALLGSVAGNLALTLGARGGVYIGGGIAPRIVGELRASAFRERFVAKGRFRDYLMGVPTFVIDARVPPALVGAARALS